MEEILHHLGCKQPCKWWDKLPGAGFSSINRMSAISVSFCSLRLESGYLKGRPCRLPDLSWCCKDALGGATSLEDGEREALQTLSCQLLWVAVSCCELLWAKGFGHLVIGKGLVYSWGHGKNGRKRHEKKACSRIIGSKYLNRASYLQTFVSCPQQNWRGKIPIFHTGKAKTGKIFIPILEDVFIKMPIHEKLPKLNI